ncbi:MAG: prepilin-type N-terminal cleavage/methylation domain-containing protein [Sedimentisphaerales bacterium]
MERKFRAFTLVELLVVISIIALLLAIMVPTLGKVREQAKVMTCAANAKQVGTLIEACRASNDGAVPVMLNRFTANGEPARSRLLSVALSSYAKPCIYTGSTARGDVSFTSEEDWGNNKDATYKPVYFKNFLPKFFVCPFVRDRDAIKLDSSGNFVDFEDGPRISYLGGDGVIHLGADGRGVKTKIRVTSGESYSVWRWERKADVKQADTSYGTPKYGALAWNKYGDIKTKEWNTLKDYPINWSSKELHRVGASSMSRATVFYCEQGQTDSFADGTNIDNGIYNYGSHKKVKNLGGTIAGFADTHVEWVEGTRIGWP